MVIEMQAAPSCQHRFTLTARHDGRDIDGELVLKHSGLSSCPALDVKVIPLFGVMILTASVASWGLSRVGFVDDGDCFTFARRVHVGVGLDDGVERYIYIR